MKQGRKGRIGREEGFTLIEIISVLVIIGILGAVSIPKFFNVQEKAREKAIYTALAELKTRVSQHFASQLLSGKPLDAITYDSAAVDIHLGGELSVEDWDATDADEIICIITYHPDSQNPTENPVSKLVSIPKPLIEIDSTEEGGEKEKKEKKDKKKK